MVAVGLVWAATALYFMYTINNQYEPSSRVLITAAHLGELDGYMCVYSDDESDVAVHVKEDYKAKSPPVGSEVTYLDSSGYIERSEDGEFYVRPSSTEVIVPGVSGEVIYYKGAPIGFISGWAGKGLVRCIYF